MRNFIAKICGLDSTIIRLERSVVDLTDELAKNETMLEFYKTQNAQLEKECDNLRAKACNNDALYKINTQQAQEVEELKTELRKKLSAIGSYKATINRLKAKQNDAGQAAV